MHRVVVTSAEAITAAGFSRIHLRQVLQANMCAGVPSNVHLPIDLVARLSEELNEPEGFIDDRKSHLGWTAAERVLTQGGLSMESLKASGLRTVVFTGTGLSSITPYELNEDLLCHIQDGAFDRSAMAKDLRSTLAAPKRHMPHYFTERLAESVGAVRSGSNFSACAAAAQAIAAGFRSVRRGEADVALVGGHDSMDHPMGLLSFVVLGALSNTRCRPFDQNRNGFMLGEGAGMLLLESLESAQRRGAPILAEVIGAGSSMDAWNPTAPHPEGVGAELSMRRALKDAQISFERVDYVNAHGTGTPLGDVAESAAIARVFGSTMKVSSIKGAIGHCLAAAGAVEAVACVDMLSEQWLAGTVGLESIDPECGVTVVTESAQTPVRTIVSNSFGFGGQNASLILKRFGV